MAAGLSPFQLIRQFKRVTGMPPHAHVTYGITPGQYARAACDAQLSPTR